ncbi:tetratricopeptide repeat protein [Streptomyces sp. WG7]|uniref:tetratricopeptide repeat protein n=1 Tax=Streptomyces sp. WG7 TaxID=3417650 RepID=UPI003CF51E72
MDGDGPARWHTGAEARGRRITTTLLMSLAAVRDADPTGLAVPVLRLASLLDPDGHPHALWTRAPLLSFLAAHRVPPAEKGTARGTTQVTADQVHAALRLLHRHALLVCDPRADPRAVRVHAATARAVRETVSDTDLPGLAVAAADALLEAWPEDDRLQAELAEVLRANTAALADRADDHLWRPDGHPVLYLAGTSLHDAGLTDAAVGYWQNMTGSAERILGADHPDTLVARNNLGVSYRQACRADEAIGSLEQVVAARERLLGPDHPDTDTARANLVVAYDESGRTEDAIDLQERVVADRERLLGPDHPDTIAARADLADLYLDDANFPYATKTLAQVVAARERLLGADHPDTVAARADLVDIMLNLE